MTDLVLHAGTSQTGRDVVCARLLSLREPLGRAGVLLPIKDDEAAWDRVAERVVLGEKARPATKLIRHADQQQSGTVLLSSESIERLLSKPKGVKNLRKFARANDVSCRVVVVVREQLGLLNALYCDRVLAMETFANFESFVNPVIQSSRYRYAEALEALANTVDVELVVVRYSRLRHGQEVEAVLLAAGVDRDTVSDLPRLDPAVADHPGGLPGPVLVAATRLTHKRLAHLDVQGMGKLMSAAEQLRERAERQGWDDTEFWGWTPEHAIAAAASYAPGNNQLAQRAWGIDWPDTPTPRPAQHLDLAAQHPALVGDVMSTIQAIVREFVS